MVLKLGKRNGSPPTEKNKRQKHEPDEEPSNEQENKNQTQEVEETLDQMVDKKEGASGSLPDDEAGETLQETLIEKEQDQNNPDESEGPSSEEIVEEEAVKRSNDEKGKEKMVGESSTIHETRGDSTTSGDARIPIRLGGHIPPHVEPHVDPPNQPPNKKIKLAFLVISLLIFVFECFAAFPYGAPLLPSKFQFLVPAVAILGGLCAVAELGFVEDRNVCSLIATILCNVIAVVVYQDEGLPIEARNAYCYYTFGSAAAVAAGKLDDFFKK